jgi:hypothetical protein
MHRDYGGPHQVPGFYFTGDPVITFAETVVNNVFASEAARLLNEALYSVQATYLWP